MKLVKNVYVTDKDFLHELSQTYSSYIFTYYIFTYLITYLCISLDLCLFTILSDFHASGTILKNMSVFWVIRLILVF